MERIPSLEIKPAVREKWLQERLKESREGHGRGEGLGKGAAV